MRELIRVVLRESRKWIYVLQEDSGLITFDIVKKVV